MTLLAFTLQPEERYLELTAPLHDLVDALEVCPETLWRSDGAGGLAPNGFHRRFVEEFARNGKRCIAHGVGFSLGSARPDPDRRRRWLDRIRADHATFDFLWYTDHFGATEIDGRMLVLPLPLPYIDAAVERVDASLAALQAIVPDVGFENSVFYAHPGDPLDEPAFLARCLRRPRTHLLLDLHNVWTTALNAGFDPRRYVDRLPLERVVEIHLSGGAYSDPAWLPSKRVMRLDSHDHEVPEDVWRLAEEVVPRCPALRALTLERMEGTVDDEHVPALREELRRARALLERS